MCPSALGALPLRSGERHERASRAVKSLVSRPLALAPLLLTSLTLRVCVCVCVYVCVCSLRALCARSLCQLPRSSRPVRPPSLASQPQLPRHLACLRYVRMRAEASREYWRRMRLYVCSHSAPLSCLCVCFHPPSVCTAAVCSASQPAPPPLAQLR